MVLSNLATASSITALTEKADAASESLGSRLFAIDGKLDAHTVAHASCLAHIAHLDQPKKLGVVKRMLGIGRTATGDSSLPLPAANMPTLVQPLAAAPQQPNPAALQEAVDPAAEWEGSQSLTAGFTAMTVFMSSKFAKVQLASVELTTAITTNAATHAGAQADAIELAAAASRISATHATTEFANAHTLAELLTTKRDGWVVANNTFFFSTTRYHWNKQLRY